MPTLQDLRENRANIWSQMTEIMERSGGTPSGEDAAAYDRAEAELDDLGGQIERGERHERTSASLTARDRTGVVGPTGGRGGGDEGASREYSQAFARFICAQEGMSALDAGDRQLLQAGYRGGREYAAAGVGSGAAGGYMVPPLFRDIIVQTLLAYGPMLRLAERIETETGATLPWPTNDDTANEGAILAENNQITQQDVTVGTNQLNAYMYTSKLVLVSWQLMQDRPDFDTWLATRLGERLARIYNRHCTTGLGSGSSQPNGIITAATVGVTGTGSLATTGGIGYANLVDLLESVDQAYLEAGDPGWMMHQTARKTIRKITDTQNRPIWEPSVQAATPDMLLGYPIVGINNHMATLATSSKSLLFGDIKMAYAVRMVRENTLVRLNERYADYLQTGFFAFGRIDGQLQNAGAVRVFQTTGTA